MAFNYAACRAVLEQHLTFAAQTEAELYDWGMEDVARQVEPDDIAAFLSVWPTPTSEQLADPTLFPGFLWTQIQTHGSSDEQGVLRITQFNRQVNIRNPAVTLMVKLLRANVNIVSFDEAAEAAFYSLGTGISRWEAGGVIMPIDRAEAEMRIGQSRVFGD